MDGLQSGHGGRGKPVSRDRWPLPGAQRDWLAFCDKVRRENGLPSLRALGKEMHLAATRVGELLRGEGLPVDEEQARALLASLGATDTEIRQGIRLYSAARTGRDQGTRTAGPPGWWLRSGYVTLVGDIAPRQLLDRDGELDELAGWCTGGDEAYVRWQAGPRAGKSALMSWLVLHPPPGTWVISFFVTARLAAQADSAAFTDGLLDQLASVTGAQVPPVASAAMRDRLRRQLLEEAAARAVKTGQRLVLVVDGLDEDCGSLPGSGLPSIAACLPKRPPDGLRVIVAGRPDPPLPADVDPDHPLRRCPVRPLDVSPHATRATQLAQQELDEVLATDKHRHDGLGYQVIGLVTASGGGLGDRDLQQLTGRPAFEIDRLLHGVFGRTVADRADPHIPARAYLFTHETLREQAVGRLGPDALDSFAERLHTWADSYWYRRWPEDTPEYLLRGYPRMLTNNIGRLTAMAADPARHQRMLHATGGDAAALAEIAAAHALISASPSPDLLAALRLARHREQLATRNAWIPVRLPAVWTALGQPVRAEALARSISRPFVLARTLANLATATAAAGDHDRARELAADAERIARAVTSPEGQKWALADVAGAAAAVNDYVWARELAVEAERIDRYGSGAYEQAPVLASVATAMAGIEEYHRAERAARSITLPDRKAEALADVARAAAAAGDFRHARKLAADAERIVRSITSPHPPPATALADVARAAAAVGDHNRAQELAADAERIARSITDPDDQARAMVYVVTAIAGDYDRAERIARSIHPQDRQAVALTDVARAAAAAGDHGRAQELAAAAEQIARSIIRPDIQAQDMADVATAVAAAGDCSRAERIARSIIYSFARQRALADVVTAIARAGDYDRAERIAGFAFDRDEQARALADVATAAAGAGSYIRAERIARSVTGPFGQARALADVATAAAAAHHYDRARGLAADAEQIACSITTWYEQPRALAAVATAAARAGDYDRAERIAQSITDPVEQTEALADVATAVGRSGDYDRAERIAQSIISPFRRPRTLADVATAAAAAHDYDRAQQLAANAERIARSILSSCDLATALADVATAAAAAHDYDRAQQLAADAERIIARSFSSSHGQAQALAALATAAAGAGNYDRAERIARSITDPVEQAKALANVATAAAVGDHIRAERIARSITDLDEQAKALAEMASSVAEPAKARTYIACALAAGRWTIPLKALALVDPGALSTFADELTASSDADNGLLSGTSARRNPGRAAGPG